MAELRRGGSALLAVFAIALSLVVLAWFTPSCESDCFMGDVLLAVAALPCAVVGALCLVVTRGMAVRWAAGLCAACNIYVLWVLAFGGLFDWVLVHSASLLACGSVWRAASELPLQPGLRPHEV